MTYFNCVILFKNVVSTQLVFIPELFPVFVPYFFEESLSFNSVFNFNFLFLCKYIGIVVLYCLKRNSRGSHGYNFNFEKYIY